MARNRAGGEGGAGVSVLRHFERGREKGFLVPPPRIVSIVFLQHIIEPKLPALMSQLKHKHFSVVFKHYSNMILAHLPRPAEFT